MIKKAQLAPGQFRPGQWVSTSLPILGAHTTPDGRPVGIYWPDHYAPQPGSEGKAPSRVLVPAFVAIQAPDGQDMVTLVGRELSDVRFRPDELPDLRAVTEADHLPETRRAHIPAGTKLRP